MMRRYVALMLMVIGGVQFLHAQRKLTVQADKPIAEISPTMWGIFFEDINFGADGGLYAEMVKNRSFEFPMPMMGWKEIKKGGTGKILIVNLGEKKPQNPRFANIKVGADNNYGITNEGFRGMGIKAEPYVFSVWARKQEGDVSINIELVSSSGKKLAGGTLSGFTNEWKRYDVAFTATDTAFKGALNILFSGKGMIDIDQVSLFPKNTWKNRPGGLRADLVQLLADMKPGFVRFPGGCIVEGRDLNNRYQWKETVAAVDDRKLMINRWNTEFRHKLTPDYFQTFGLGFYEYFLLSEDIGAEPLPILNCGMACQYNTGEVVAMNELDSYVQDALDLIEFANGDSTTKWGRHRAQLGHPQPFNLKYIGIGNEQWDEQYVERFAAFEKVLKKQYPDIKLVAAAGPSADGPRFEYAWKEFRKMNVDLMDEHYYQEPGWFLKNAHRYDNYDRKGPKVFAGEYAAQSKATASAENRNNWQCALAEAAFMTGLERNADVVVMSSYAPLFAHVDAWQWTPDLIWFDNLRAYGTPNYYVQKMFATNKGTHAVPITENGSALKGQDSIYASAVLDKKKNQLIIKIVNASAKPVPISLDVKGATVRKGQAVMEVLSSDDRLAVNTLDDPKFLSPIELPIAAIRAKSIVINALSVNVIKIPM
ncbi:MAG TPA: alpha-L-arabinofuranosidase C-terminal domain-containing protein [Chitinophagaceae bacterium]